MDSLARMLFTESDSAQTLGYESETCFSVQILNFQQINVLSCRKLIKVAAHVIEGGTSQHPFLNYLPTAN